MACQFFEFRNLSKSFFFFLIGPYFFFFLLKLNRKNIKLQGKKYLLNNRVLKIHFSHRDELFLFFLLDSATFIYYIRNYYNQRSFLIYSNSQMIVKSFEVRFFFEKFKFV